MKRKIVSLLASSIISAIVLSSTCFAVTQTKGVTIFLTLNQPYMTVNTELKEIDPGRGTAPIISDNRVFVPIRAVIENIGGQVAWDDKTQKVTLAMNGKKVELWIGKKQMSINGASQSIDVAPMIKGGRTLLPVRFAAESFGCNVNWDPDKKQASIVYNPLSENSSAASIKAPAVTAKAGEQVSYVVKTSSIKNLGKFIVDINFDPTKLSFKEAKNGNIKSSDYIGKFGDVDTSVADKGTVSVMSSDESPVSTSDGDLFTLVFDVKSGATGTVNIQLKPELYDSNVTLIPVKVDAGSITIK